MPTAIFTVISNKFKFEFVAWYCFYIVIYSIIYQDGYICTQTYLSLPLWSLNIHTLCIRSRTLYVHLTTLRYII